MSNHTIPLAVPDDLLQEVRDAATDTHLSQADVMRQSMKLGLGPLRRSLGSKRSRPGAGGSVWNALASGGGLRGEFPRMAGKVRKVSL